MRRPSRLCNYVSKPHFAPSSRQVFSVGYPVPSPRYSGAAAGKKFPLTGHVGCTRLLAFSFSSG